MLMRFDRSYSLAVILGTVAVVLAGCDSDPARSPVRGKPGAPVGINMLVDGQDARITVEFQAAARNVHVNIRGSAGLSIKQRAWRLADVQSGELWAQPITLPEHAHGLLVVTVTMDTGGRTQTRIATATVGGFSHQGGLQPTSGRVEQQNGEPVRILPAH